MIVALKNWRERLQAQERTPGDRLSPTQAEGALTAELAGGADGLFRQLHAAILKDRRESEMTPTIDALGAHFSASRALTPAENRSIMRLVLSNSKCVDGGGES